MNTSIDLNPKLHDIERGIAQLRNARPDLVIALGGGSAIDLAKLIGTLANQDSPAPEIIQGNACIRQGGPPLVAIPLQLVSGR